MWFFTIDSGIDWSQQKIVIFLTHLSENAHFTLEFRVFNDWRTMDQKDGNFLFWSMPEPMVTFLGLKKHTFINLSSNYPVFYGPYCTYLISDEPTWAVWRKSIGWPICVRSIRGLLQKYFNSHSRSRILHTIWLNCTLWVSVTFEQINDAYVGFMQIRPILSLAVEKGGLTATQIWLL